MSGMQKFKNSCGGVEEEQGEGRWKRGRGERGQGNGNERGKGEYGHINVPGGETNGQTNGGTEE